MGVVLRHVQGFPIKRLIITGNLRRNVETRSPNAQPKLTSSKPSRLLPSGRPGFSNPSLASPSRHRPLGHQVSRRLFPDRKPRHSPPMISQGIEERIRLGVGMVDFCVDKVVRVRLTTVSAIRANRGPANTASPNMSRILTAMATNVLRLRRWRRDWFGRSWPLVDGRKGGACALPVFVVCARVLASVSNDMFWWRWRGWS